MKRYAILTSVIVLAACGGGSHSGGSGIAPNAAPAFRSSDLFSDTENNSNVTQMQTQIIVDSHGNVVSPNTSRRAGIRSGSIQDTSGNTYAVYDLSDVKLKVADSVPAWLKIGLTEDGAIKDITLSSGGVESTLARDGDTNSFHGPIFEYVQDTIRNPEGTPDLSTEELRNTYKDNQHWKSGKWAKDSGDNWYYIEYGDKAKFRMVDGTEFGTELTSIEGFSDTLENGHATMATLNLIESSRTELTGGHWNRIDERMDVETNKHISEGDANPVVLQYSDFGHFNPVYRSKHVDLNNTVLNAIRAHGAEIDAALSSDTFNQASFDTLVSGYGLNRSGLDKYRNNEEFEEKLESQDYQLFAGGYAIDANGQLIEGGTFDAPRNTTFSGTGIGRVYTSIHAKSDGTETEYKTAILSQYGIENDGVDAGHDVSKTFTTSSAYLNVDANGNQVLEMNFPDFYKVTATQNVGESNPTVVLEKVNGVTIEKKYMKTADVALPTYDTEQYQVTSNGTTTPETPFFEPGYYGVGTASEAAGLIRYAETTDNIVVTDTDSSTGKNFKREFEFQGAYGMKK